MDVIAVHAGAGYQSEQNKEAYFQVCRDACKAAMDSFAVNRSALDAAVSAVSVLEDSQMTNAGYGSNLCKDGSVECDASVMDGSTSIWAAVGALSGLKNPIRVAKGLYDHQMEETVCGLVNPCLLVGEGAKKWSLERNITPEADLVTEKSRAALRKYTERVESAVKNKRLKTENGSNIQGNLSKLDFKKDTVGAVTVSAEGVTAAAVSSGGVFLKVNGRLGQAASFGSGSWAQENIAVTTSGVGEYLIKTLLASKIAEDLAAVKGDTNIVECLESSVKTRFMDSQFLKGIEAKDRIAGILGVVIDSESSVVELFCTHSSPSMVFGYQTSEMEDPETILSRASEQKGHSFTTQAFMLSKQ